VVETTPVVETKPVESTEEVKVEEVTEPVDVEVIDPTETVEPENTYLGNFKLTAYCACAKCCGKSDGITATGAVATQGRTIAVDPSVIPYGTAVSINGNTYIAEDCGGAIGGNRIDVFFNNHTDALNFGVQYADVYLLGVD
jgi:3D (Asp-Asp-Asp) domain-containing protein